MAEAFRFEFTWDAAKDQANLAKHGVTFDQASTVFSDPLAQTIYDPDHSDAEERWITIGKAANNKCLVVCHTVHQNSPSVAVVRLISARKATKTEIRSYEENLL